LVLVGSVATCLITGAWEILPALIGLSSCVLLVALGVSSVTSAAFPYPTVRPGDSPFAQPQAAGTTGSVVQSLSFFASALAAAPAVVLIVLAATNPTLYWGAFAAGLGIGLAVIVGGAAWGGWIVNRRSPELLEFTLQN
jgi:ABC-2 type transport system permease protein